MARSSTGKWVARAAATGGGRTYRGQRPTNWYLVLVVIVVVGVVSFGVARHQYQKGKPAATAPAVGTTWYAGFAFDICGTEKASPAANANASSVGISTSGNGVITIAPKKAAEAGNNATLGRFVADYKGMDLTPTSIRYPGGPLYRNGETCPQGSPDAGKRGVVLVRYWSGPGAAANQGKLVSGDPRDLKFTNGQLITMGFAPSGTDLPKPSGTVVVALLNDLNSSASGSTTTTSPGSAATTPTTTASSGTTTPTTSATTTTGASSSGSTATSTTAK